MFTSYIFERSRDRFLICWFIPQMPSLALTGPGWSRSLEPNTDLPTEWRRHRLLSPRVVCSSRSLGSEVGLGLTPRHCDAGYGSPKPCLNCYTNIVPLRFDLKLPKLEVHPLAQTRSSLCLFNADLAWKELYLCLSDIKTACMQLCNEWFFIRFY